ncbi:MAG: hypothetical protein Q7Q73_10360 [Verrucomicrobiota bacterium JB024]|nr:hypothetical protein [Verrucomicrobiota bacterium JB024]
MTAIDSFKMRKSLIALAAIVVLSPLIFMLMFAEDTRWIDTDQVASDLREQLLTQAPYTGLLQQHGISSLEGNGLRIPGTGTGEASYRVSYDRLLIVYFSGKQAPFTLHKIILTNGMTSDTLFEQ